VVRDFDGDVMTGTVVMHHAHTLQCGSVDNFSIYGRCLGSHQMEKMLHSGESCMTMATPKTWTKTS
jgi:hypothetical protein